MRSLAIRIQNVRSWGWLVDALAIYRIFEIDNRDWPVQLHQAVAKRNCLMKADAGFFLNANSLHAALAVCRSETGYWVTRMNRGRDTHDTCWRAAVVQVLLGSILLLVVVWFHFNMYNQLVPVLTLLVRIGITWKMNLETPCMFELEQNKICVVALAWSYFLASTCTSLSVSPGRDIRNTRACGWLDAVSAKY